MIAAARAAGLHDIILGLPDGYETRLAVALSSCPQASASFGLYGALYRDPHLVVLDEANSNLDAAGDEALAGRSRVKARGGMVVMITHRPPLRPVTIALMPRPGGSSTWIPATRFSLGCGTQPAQGGVPA